MATVQKSTKINFYKFVAVKEPSSSVAAKSGANIETVRAINTNTKAINGIGETLNGITKVLDDLKKVQLAALTAEQRKNVSFKAQYTTPQASKQQASLVTDAVSKSGSFFDGILKALGGLFKSAIVIPALQWLADPKNQETIQTALKIVKTVAQFIFDWAKFGITNTIDGLYNLLKDDATWWERILGLGQAIAGVGAIVLGLRYLFRPKKLIADIASSIKALIGFVTGGGRRGAKGGGGNPPRRKRRLNPFRRRAYGGLLPEAAQGGWISGPQSGYKVSLDGGRSTSFIGHGTEYVARKSNGGAFVVPFNTPGTKTQPHLTQKRLGEAKRLGFFANGGEITGTNEQKWSQVATMGRNAGAKYPNLVAAQFALESAWGTATSGRNNFFGIKATGSEPATVHRTREVVNGQDVFVNARFKDFRTPQDSVNHLVKQWYKDYRGYSGVNNASDVLAAADMLKTEGYATDPVYAQSLKRLLGEYSGVRQTGGNPVMNFLSGLFGGNKNSEHNDTKETGRTPEYKGSTPGVIGVSHPDTGAGYGIDGQEDQSGRPLAFSQPAAEQFAKALKASGMDLGSFVASTGRSDAKNRSVGGHPNSHHMYGEAIDMNGAGYEWMKKNGRRYGWQYVYNHGPGSAHFKYVGPGAGSTPKLGPPGRAPKVQPSSSSTAAGATNKKTIASSSIFGGDPIRSSVDEGYTSGNLSQHGQLKKKEVDELRKITEQRNQAQQQMRAKSSEMINTALEAVKASNGANAQVISQAQAALQQAMAMGRGGQPQIIPTGAATGGSTFSGVAGSIAGTAVKALASQSNPLRGIFK